MQQHWKRCWWSSALTFSCSLWSHVSYIESTSCVYFVQLLCNGRWCSHDVAVGGVVSVQMLLTSLLVTFSQPSIPRMTITVYKLSFVQCQQVFESYFSYKQWRVITQLIILVWTVLFRFVFYSFSFDSSKINPGRVSAVNCSYTLVSTMPWC
jgi:hypothetical protein